MIVKTDAVSGSLQAIDQAHHEIHEGDHYSFTIYGDPKGVDDTIEFIIVTPASAKEAHMVFSFDSALKGQIDLFIDTTHGVGAEQTVHNDDHNSLNTNDTKIYLSAAGGADGSSKYKKVFGIDTGIGITTVIGGGKERGDREKILKRATKYLVRLTSLTAGNVLSIDVSWYEHTRPST